MSLAKVRSALVQALVSANVVTTDKIFSANRAGTTPLQGMWVVIEFTPNEQSPVTLGRGGDDRAAGEFSVGFTYPKDTGESMAFDAISVLNTIFVAGKEFTFEGHHTKIDSVRTAASFPVPNAHRTPYIVNWSSRIKRHIA